MSVTKFILFLTFCAFTTPAISSTYNDAALLLDRTNQIVESLGDTSSNPSAIIDELRLIRWTNESVNALTDLDKQKLKLLDTVIYDRLMAIINSSQNHHVKFVAHTNLISYFDLDSDEPRINFMSLEDKQKPGLTIARQLKSMDDKQRFAILLHQFRLHELRSKGLPYVESNLTADLRKAVNEAELSAANRQSLINELSNRFDIPDCLRAELCEVVKRNFDNGRMKPSLDRNLVRAGISFKATGVFGAVGVGAALLKQASTSDSVEANQID